MNIIIRSEQVKDYNQIAIVNYEAFHNWKSDNPFVKEPLMVDVLRHNSLFDFELSLVAEFNNEIIGHVIFSPFTYTFSGEEVNGAILGPIAIKPKYQKQGVGGKLITAGHKILKEKGYALSLLCGHTEYYPKFGYKTSMFAFSGSKVTVNERNYDIKNIEEKPVSTADMPWINAKWFDVHSNDLIAINPGKTIIDYANHGSPCYCSMILKDDKVIAYVRYQISSDMTIKELLADKGDTVEVLEYLSCKHQGTLNINLSYNYLNEILGNNKMFTLEDTATAYDAFMIIPLKESGCATEYCNDVESKKIKPGVISLPPVYDIEE